MKMPLMPPPITVNTQCTRESFLEIKDMEYAERKKFKECIKRETKPGYQKIKDIKYNQEV